jgi:hypothetical protein
MNIVTHIGMLARGFIEVWKLAGTQLLESDIETQILISLQKRTWLPRGKAAGYASSDGECCVKAGKVGSKSGSRFRSQHCLPGGAKSTLARGLYLDHSSDFAITGFFCDDLAPGFYGELASDWKSKALSRVHFFIDATAEPSSVRLLEVFYQCRLHPIFVEGN